jgi:hypothetical protein
MYPVEDIPNPAKVFIRIHDSDIRNGDVVAGAFKERGEGNQKGMSADWEKYSSPEIIINRKANPNVYSVGSFIAGEVREIPLIVEHAPLWPPPEDNQAHTNIKGLDDNVTKTERRAKLKVQMKIELESEIFKVQKRNQ